jgi:hypothetical protein
MGVKDQTCPKQYQKRLGPLLKMPWLRPEEGVKNHVAKRGPKDEWVKLLKLNSLNATVFRKKEPIVSVPLFLLRERSLVLVPLFSKSELNGISTTVFRKDEDAMPEVLTRIRLVAYSRGGCVPYPSRRNWRTACTRTTDRCRKHDYPTTAAHELWNAVEGAPDLDRVYRGSSGFSDDSGGFPDAKDAL